MKLNIQLFAGSVSIGTITETTDINTNQSTFTIPATMTTTGTTYNNDNAYMTLQWKYASSSSWTSLSKQTFGIGKNSSKTKSWTLTLDHNADGTLENINFRVKWYITDSTNGTTGTTTKTPTTIPRASTIDSVTGGTTPYYPTIKWTPKSSSFKYKVKYYYRNNSYTSGLITPSTTNQYTYNSLLIPNAIFNGVQTTSIEAIAELYTYQSDGTTQIGTAATKTFTVTLNSSIKPNLGISNLAEADSTMISKNWGIYVQGKSKLSFHLGYAYENPTPSSSTVTATTNGQTFSSTSMNGYLDYTTSTLKTAGTNTLTATIVDSRNRSATDSETYNVVAYSVPTINIAQVQRCDVNGNVDKNGQYCLISYNASISSCDNHNKTGAEYKVGYRVQNTGSYQYISLGTNANSKSASGILFTDGIKSASSSGTKVQFSDSTYDIQFYVKDSFTTITNTQSLDAGFDLLNFNPSGKAMAIGKVSEAGANEELLEIAMPTQLILGTYNAESENISGATKFLNIMNLEIIKEWLDVPLIFNLSSRGNHWARVFVRFTNNNTTDPTLLKFSYICSNGCPLNPRIKKVGTSNWSIYVNAANNDRVEITQLEYPPYLAKRLKITYPNALVSTLDDATLADYEEVFSKQTKIYQQTIDNSDGVNFYPLGTTEQANGLQTAYRTGSFTIYSRRGTTSIDGGNGIILGNSTASGTDGNKKGEIRLFTLGTGSNYIEPAASHSSTYYNYLPTHGGTFQVQPIQLYNNSDGTSGNVALSETSANYKYLEIFYRYSDNSTRGSLKVFNPNGRKFQITMSYDNGTYLYINTGNYTISGNTITADSQIRWRIGTSGNATRSTGATNITIYRVDGIRTN